jgi:5-methyltetrahydrofolate--homocysteine methyltransferase
MKTPAYTRAQALPGILQQRIVVLDGAMGTMIQRHKLARPISAATGSATTRRT